MRDTLLIHQLDSDHGAPDPSNLWMLDAPSGCAFTVDETYAALFVPETPTRILYSRYFSPCREIAENSGRPEGFSREDPSWFFAPVLFNVETREASDLIWRGLHGGGRLWIENGEIRGTRFPCGSPDGDPRFNDGRSDIPRRLALTPSPHWEPIPGERLREEAPESGAIDMESLALTQGTTIARSRDGHISLLIAVDFDFPVLQPAIDLPWALREDHLDSAECDARLPRSVL